MWIWWDLEVSDDIGHSSHWWGRAGVGILGEWEGVGNYTPVQKGWGGTEDPLEYKLNCRFHYIFWVLNICYR